MESQAADVSAAGESYRERLVATTASTTIVSAEAVTVSSIKTTVGTIHTDSSEVTAASPLTAVSLTGQPPLALLAGSSGLNNSFGGDSDGGAAKKAATQQQPSQDAPCTPASPKIINELSPKLGTNQNSSGGKGTRNNASSSSSSSVGIASVNKEALKQRKSAEGGTGSNPIHHIVASGSPARHGTSEGGSAGAGTTETGRRTSTVAHAAPANNTTSTTRNSTKPCCFCWCCCYRCTW